MAPVFQHVSDWSKPIEKNNKKKKIKKKKLQRSQSHFMSDSQLGPANILHPM